MLRCQLIVVGLFLAPFTSALAQSTSERLNSNDSSDITQEYRAPDGFGGYAWKTPLGQVERLAPEPLYVRVAHTGGKITMFDYSCWNNLTESGVANINAMTACRNVEGAGYHALAEYRVESQGFRITDEKGRKVVFFPLTYQFCAHWNGFSPSLKGDPKEVMQLCGVNFYFKSETAAQAAAFSDPERRTPYERILVWLIKTHGEPEGFDRGAWVYIPLWDLDLPRAKKAFEERHRNWRWCRPRGDELVPNCEASIVMNFDAKSGRGQVLYATGPIWTYAHARQFGGSPGDELYYVLHGGIKPAKVRHQCMDSFLCAPPKPAAMSEKMLARFRVTDTKE